MTSLASIIVLTHLSLGCLTLFFAILISIAVDFYRMITFSKC